ncbi:MAG: glycosyltransferase family 2 protein [Candidatus Omnitrophica bacterium]|nr:glycosyltransferase family 2 protein [Candidatus Omnitrophota bacterium]
MKSAGVPAASVIIPLYNKARYIERAIQSVLSQSFPYFELIIVNDGSTDESVLAVNGIKDPRIILIHQENAGPGAARNKGVQTARGKYVALLDADDEWLPSFLHEAVAFLADHPEASTVSLGYYRSNVFDQASSALLDKRKLFEGIYEVDSSFDPAWCEYLLSYMSPCTTVFRKEVIEKYGGFFDRWKCICGEDHWLMLKVLLNQKVAVLRKRLVIIHSECSELYVNNKINALPVVLIEPEGILSSCLEVKKVIAGRILACIAIYRAIDCIYFDEVSKARDLLEQFCKEYKPLAYYKACLLIRLSVQFRPLQNFVRFLCRNSFWRG